jgi:tRNA dimethylallyltransferase
MSAPPPSAPERLADLVRPGRHLALVGTTASGKSALALELARRDPLVELISVDSMQVYRGMDIGTAKPTAAEQAEVRHHLIDIVEPDDDYTVARFAHDVRVVLRDLEARGRRGILIGGTGLYARAAVEDFEIPPQFPATRVELEREPDTVALHRRLEALDPVAASRMEPANRRRVVRALEVTLGSGRPFSSYGPGLTAYPPSPIAMVGVRLPRSVVDARIARRYEDQLRDGFLDEVRQLAARPRGLSRTARQALGYRELLSHLEQDVPLAEAVELAVTRTRRFARRQERWFRRDPRITWLDPPAGAGDDPASLLDAIEERFRTGERAGAAVEQPVAPSPAGGRLEPGLNDAGDLPD